MNRYFSAREVFQCLGLVHVGLYLCFVYRSYPLKLPFNDTNTFRYAYSTEQFTTLVVHLCPGQGFDSPSVEPTLLTM